jgi:hypothetical protein
MASAAIPFTVQGARRKVQDKESNPFIREPCAVSRAPFLFFKF